MTGAPLQVVLCNGANLPEALSPQAESNLLNLEYRQSETSEPNVKISLPDFIRGVDYVPPRILDLLEIAAYVFAADRSTFRGAKNALEYQSWARSFHFVFKVRDYAFWSTSPASRKLSEALSFMAGDREYNFSFQPGHSTTPASLFDREEFEIRPQMNNSVVLFSGGLDSLAGIVERLETTNEQICLVSHRSQPSITGTQDRLLKALDARYPNRLMHYRFQCSLAKVRATEETQRTRGFLYATIAYALSHVLLQDKAFFVYENGVTTINFPKRQDMVNARSSRTTHPKSIALLERFFSEVEESKVQISTPFLWQTKTDVLRTISSFGRDDLITSAVSCSKTFQNLEQATHCGHCSQCIDRRFAAYGAEVDGIDESGIYASDFIQHRVEGEVKTTLVDYVRQARDFANWNIDYFYKELLDELVDLTDYVAKPNEEEAVEHIHSLCRRHGQQVLEAVIKMRNTHDDLSRKIVEGSFLSLVNNREYLKKPVLRLVSDVCDSLSNALPLAFQRELPKNENHLNDMISAILNSNSNKFEREHPFVRFSLAHAVPDHSLNGNYLFIESKYIRNSTTPSRVSEGLAADLTKYPEESHILFLVYDPNRSISDDNLFRIDFERGSRCTVCIIR